MHRSLGQQYQDGGAHVATAATPTVSATSSTASTARAGAETEAEAGSETPAEAGSETRADTRAERPAVAGVVAADMVAELAPMSAGLPALLVQCTPCMRPEAKEVGALCSGTPGEFPFWMGKRVVHM